MSPYIERLNGRCPCGTEAIGVFVYVSGDFRVTLSWTCNSCKKETIAEWTISELVQKIRQLARLANEDVEKASKFSEEDESYLKEMHIELGGDDA